MFVYIFIGALMLTWHKWIILCPILLCYQTNSPSKHCVRVELITVIPTNLAPCWEYYRIKEYMRRFEILWICFCDTVF